MNWNFIKTNWFYLAMAIMLLLIIFRKYPKFNPFQPSGKMVPNEKITEAKDKRKGGAALLGLVPDSSKESKEEILEIDPGQAKAFLKRFASVALSEHKKFGIPTSILLAAAYSNSQAGQSKSARIAKNYFALPCGEGWENETTQVNGQCVRQYESAWASFRDFSIYLSSQEWFGSLKKSAGKDWHKWVEKLGEEGVAKTKEMQQVIELYQLDAL